MCVIYVRSTPQSPFHIALSTAQRMVNQPIHCFCAKVAQQGKVAAAGGTQGGRWHPN